MSNLSLTLGIALVASLGANLWQAVSDSEPHTRSPIKPGVSGTNAGTDAPPSVREVEVCERKLERCTVARRARPLLFGPAARRDDANGGRNAEAVEDEPTPFLCELARDQAIAQWREKEGAIVLAMRQSLADPELQARDVEAAVERFGDHLDLSQSDRETLSTRYEEVRLRRIEKIRAKIESDPPDYEAIVRHSRKLFEEEDTIAAELFGDDAAAKIRDKELESRSTILSIAASLGELPWDENVIP